MFGWIGHIFCNHIWRITGAQQLGQVHKWGMTFNRTGVSMECIKCRKQKIKEQWTDTLFDRSGHE